MKDQLLLLKKELIRCNRRYYWYDGCVHFIVIFNQHVISRKK